jgi:hypothetical protein
MRLMTRHRGYAVAIVTALVLLGGCGGDEPEPGSGPGSGPSALSVSPRPTPPPPSPPDPVEAIREVKTPQEFIRLWEKTETEMLNTGDTAVYRAITEGCVPCKKLAKQVEGFYAAGGYVKTKGWRVDSIKRAGKSGGNPVFVVRRTVEPTVYRESKTGPVKGLAGGRTATRVTLVNEQFEGWLLVEAFKMPVTR